MSRLPTDTFSICMTDAKRHARKKEFGACLDQLLGARAAITELLGSSQMGKCRQAIAELDQFIQNFSWTRMDNPTMLQFARSFPIPAFLAVDVAEKHPDSIDAINASVLMGVGFNPEKDYSDLCFWSQHLVTLGNFRELNAIHRKLNGHGENEVFSRFAHDLDKIHRLDPEQEQAFTHVVILNRKHGYDYPEISLADRSGFHEIAGRMAKYSWPFLKDTANHSAVTKLKLIKRLSFGSRQQMAILLGQRLKDRDGLLGLFLLMAFCEGYRIFGQRGGALTSMAMLIARRAEMHSLHGQTSARLAEFLDDVFDRAKGLVDESLLHKNCVEFMTGVMAKIDAMGEATTSQYFSKVLDHLSRQAASREDGLGNALDNVKNIRSRIKRRSLEDDLGL